MSQCIVDCAKSSILILSHITSACLCAVHLSYICFQRDVNITDGRTESVISYTISYTDVTTRSVCGSATILHSSCVMNDICIHIFDVLSSSCSHSVPINVTVSALNVFGAGPPSHPSLVFG